MKYNKIIHHEILYLMMLYFMMIINIIESFLNINKYI